MTTSAQEALANYLDGRTFGYDHRFYWRGPGYDDGWENITPVEAEELLPLVTAAMNEFVGKSEETDVYLWRKGWAHPLHIAFEYNLLVQEFADKSPDNFIFFATLVTVVT